MPFLIMCPVKEVGFMVGVKANRVIWTTKADEAPSFKTEGEARAFAETIYPKWKAGHLLIVEVHENSKL
jgi:hypothetical protein